MNGAQLLMRTLVRNGVDTCFMNPGTSEMQFVAALDDVPEMHAVLALFEGVATGAADGYGRITGTPAATLLHLGPGLANGLANLHNARRAATPVVTVVGDHATDHQRFDAPLQSDIAALAGWTEGWWRAVGAVADLGPAVVEAVAAACGPPGRVATLVVPADLTWLEAGADVLAASARSTLGAVSRHLDADALDAAAKALSGERRGAVLIGGEATVEAGLTASARIAAATGAKLLCETFPARLERGAGLPAVERLGYLSEFAAAQLDGIDVLVLAGARPPVAFFAYPDQPSSLVPAGCDVIDLAGQDGDPVAALDALAAVLGAPAPVATQPAGRPDPPTGPLTPAGVAAAVGALLPEGAIVSDESNTAGLFIPGSTAGAPRHDWLCLTGGAIGQGLPVATGAAVAAPDRTVVCLEADGSAMYTLQALWTQARLGLDVTTVIFDNGAYAILELELSRVGAGTPGPLASAMLDLGSPPLDFVALARGLGVPAVRATTGEAFTDELGRALAAPGPAVVVAGVGRGL
jgi:acetolactate synthase I/II/III large subunit